MWYAPGMMRETGHYWIKVIDEWTIGHWDGEVGRWLQIGDEQGLEDKHLEMVGEFITPPGSDT
jgi:hypothetical protein